MLAPLASLVACAPGVDLPGPPDEPTPSAAGWSVEELGRGCASAHGAAVPFLDRTAGDLLRPFVNDSAPDDLWPDSFGGGAAAADFDGDGLPDLVLTDRGTPPRLLWNRGDFVFEEGGVTLGPDRLVTGASTADWDDDGDPDLWILAEGPDRLFRNDDGVLVEVSGGVGPGRSLSTAFGDLDGDGRLDAVSCSFFGNEADSDQQPAPDHAYLGDGEGGFVDRPDLLPGIQETSGCFAVAFAPLLDVGAQVVMVHDKGEFFTADRLFVEQGGQWSDEAEARGADQRHSGMGIAVLDLDGDGHLDLWKTSSPQDKLLRNLGDGTFADASAAVGLIGERPGTSWDVDAWDVDDDGDPDVLAAHAGYIDPSVPGDSAQPDILWRNDGGSVSPEDPAELGLLEAAIDRSIVRADFDDDGAMDLLLPTLELGARVFQGRCSDGGFLRVRVEGSHCPRDAAGAHVQLTAGGRAQVQAVIRGGQYGSAQPGELHFGLGGAQPESLRVRWPCGVEAEVDDLQADTRVTVTEPG